MLRPASPPAPAVPPSVARNRYGGFWARVGAYFIDAVLIAVAGSALRLDDVGLNVLVIAYLIVAWSVGGTIGMRVLGMRLVDAKGGRPGPVRAVVRYIGLVLSALALLLGLLWVAIDRRKQGWHDKIAGTFVVRGAYSPEAAGAPGAAVPGGPGAPVAGAPAVATAQRRGGVGPVATVLLGLLVLFFGATTALAAYIVAPDLPPLAFPTEAQLADRFTFLQSAPDRPVPTRNPTIQRLRSTARPPDATATRAAQAAQQLRSTGLPFTTVSIESTESGDRVLVAGLDFDRLAAFGSTGFNEGMNALIRVGQNKTIDLKGLDAVTTALHDSQGRVLVALSAKTADLERFRAGQMSRTDFIRATGLETVSRVGVIDAIRRQVAK